MLIFGHTCLVFKDLIRTYFCGFYVILWDFIEVKKTSFSIPQNPSQTDWRSTEPVDRISGRSIGTVDRCARGRAHGQPTRPVDRAVDRLKAPHSRVGAGRPGGRPEAQWS